MTESKFQRISVDIMDARDGIYLGRMMIDTNRDIIIDRYGDKPVMSYLRVKQIVQERRPTLKNRDLDFASSVAIFNKYD